MHFDTSAKNAIVLYAVISSPYQLIGVVAAKYKISKEEGIRVYLDLKYEQYWFKSNIPVSWKDYILEAGRELNEVLSKEPELRVETVQVFINHAGLSFRSRKIVVDDGLGAYRKNPFNMIKTKAREKSLIEKGKYSRGLGRGALNFILNQLGSVCYFNHVSIFKKSPLNYFSVNSDNIPFFRRAIRELACNDSFSWVMPRNSIIFITQPWEVIGFVSEREYHNEVVKLRDRLSLLYPDSKVFIKKHPVDTYNYQEIGLLQVETEVPAEIFFEKYHTLITAVVGFNSTTLLTAKILYGLESFYILMPGECVPIKDFWAVKAFKKHVKLFKV